MTKKMDIDILRRAVAKRLKEGFDHDPMNSLGDSESFLVYNPEEAAEEFEDGGLEKIKQTLFKLSVYAARLHDMLNEGVQLEGSLEEMVMDASEKVEEAYHTLEYNKFKETR